MATLAHAPTAATIKSGSTTHKVSFPVVDETDKSTLETGIVGGWTVVSNRAGTVTTWTTPTVSEVSGMDGVYELTLDEDTTATANSQQEQMYITLTNSGVADVHISVMIVETPQVDMVSISGDTPAADALETMLDGTGGNTLSLGSLNITTTGNDSGIFIDASSGIGDAINATGGSRGIRLAGGSSYGMTITASGQDAVQFEASNTSYYPLDLVNSANSTKDGVRGSLYGNVEGDVTGDVTGLGAVVLADSGAHGGSSTILTFNRMVGSSTSANPCVTLSGGTGTQNSHGVSIDGGTDSAAVLLSSGNTRSTLYISAPNSSTNSFSVSVEGNNDDIAVNLQSAAASNGDGILSGKPAATWLEEFLLTATGGEYTGAVNQSVVQEILDGVAAGAAASATTELLQSTTIATLASQVSFTLTDGSTDDDAYNLAKVIVTDAATSTQKAVGYISDYTGSTKTVTLDSDPGIFTMGVGDTIDIFASDAAAGAAPTAAAVADAVWDEARSGHTTAGTYGEFVLTPHVLQETTIATLASQTSFTLTAGSTDDDAYRNAVIIVQDASTQEQKGFARIQDYTGSTKTVTLQADLTPFTIATTDKVFIVQTPQVWDAELTGSLHNLARSSGRRLRRAQALLGADDDGLIDEGTAQAGTSTTIQIRAAYAGDIDDGTVVAIEGGTGSGQVREVGSYDTGTNTITIAGDNWATTPDSTSEYFVAHPQFCDMVVTGSNPTAAEIRTEIDSNSTQLAAIVADTNELQVDWVDGGRLDLILDELTTQGDTNETKIDTIDTNVDAILVDTGTTLPATLGTPAGADMSTDIAAIKAETVLIVADTNELQTDWTDGGRLDLILDELTTQGDTNETLITTVDTVVDTIAAASAGAFQKNVAKANYGFTMFNSGSPTTGLTVTCERSLDGAAFASCTNTPATEIGNGVYEIDLSAADLNADTVIFKATATGADATFHYIYPV